MPNTFPLHEITAHIKGVLQKAPVTLGNDAVNFFLDRFKDQAWLNTTREPWQPRKANTKWGKTKRNNGRAILIDSGRLRRSIRVTGLAPMQATIGTDVPYARAHNEGFKGTVTQNVKSFQRKSKKGFSTVKAHTRTINQNIPRRQFMGDSIQLTNMLKRNLTDALMKGYSNYF